MQRLKRPLIIVGVLGLMAFMVTLLPQGYDTDLSQVGGDRPAVVIVHDPNIVQSGNLMHALDRVRGDFETNVRFLVADQNLADGAAFATAHRLRIATLVLFDADGNRLDVYTGGGDPEAIRAWLAQHADSGALR